MRVILLGSLLILLAQSPLYASDLEDAHRAYGAGEFDEAVSLLGPLVRENNPQAQYLLGRMFEQGDGVKRNTSEAAKLFRLAADQGHDQAKQRLSQLDTTGGEDSVVVDWYLPAAREGDIEAQYNLGYMYETGWGVGTNDIEATRWYEQAATGGHDQAQLRLGMMTVLGMGVDKDRAAGVNLLKQSATNGNRIADKLVQEVFDSGQLTDAEVEKLLRGLRRILDDGEQKALDTLSSNIERARLKKLSTPSRVAREEPRRAQSEPLVSRPSTPPPLLNNDPQPQRQQSEPIFNNRTAPGAPSNNSRDAFRQNQFGQNAMSPSSQVVTSPLRNGQSRGQEVFVADPMPQKSGGFDSRPMPEMLDAPSFASRNGRNDEEMAQWYMQSAKSGNADSQLSLGILYIQGRGVRENQQEGLRWIRGAAGQGHELAQYYLELWNGQLEKYAGRGTVGISWLMEQARHWDANALFQLGFLFESGRGVVKNNAEALKWYRLAAAQGHQDARNRLNAVSRGGAPVANALGGASSASDGGQSPILIIALLVLVAGLLVIVFVLGPKQLRLKLLNLSPFKRKPLKAIPHLPARNMDPEDVEFLRSLWGADGGHNAAVATSESKPRAPKQAMAAVEEQLNPDKLAAEKRAAAEELERKIAERTRAIRESIGNRNRDKADSKAADESAPKVAARHPGAAHDTASLSKPDKADKPASPAKTAGSEKKKGSFSADSFNKGNISRDALASKRVSADSLFGDTFPIDKKRSVVHRVDHGSKKLSADSLLSSMDSGFKKSSKLSADSGKSSVDQRQGTRSGFDSLSAEDISIRGKQTDSALSAMDSFDEPAVVRLEEDASPINLQAEPESRDPKPAEDVQQAEVAAPENFSSKFVLAEDDIDNVEPVTKVEKSVTRTLDEMEPPVRHVSGKVVDVNLSHEEERSLAEVHYNIARMFARGDGVPQNETLAAKWYLKAAEAGLPEAQFCLAEYYLSGRGIGKDIELGLKWLQKAADSGYQPAKDLLDKRRNIAS